LVADFFLQLFYHSLGLRQGSYGWIGSDGHLAAVGVGFNDCAVLFYRGLFAKRL